MGGGGGGFFTGGSRPEDLLRRRREAEEGTRDAAFEAVVGDFLGALLAEFNGRDVERTRQFFAQMERDLGEEIEGTIQTLFGGSVAKRTYVDGISDVDALVLLNDSNLADKGPDGAKRLLAAALRSRYGRDAVRVGEVAVTVTVGGEEIQLLPALRDGGGFRITNSAGTGWSRIRPQRFASALTKANQRLSDKLVPCIKLAKAIVSTLPESHRISGYHLESLAVRVFRTYGGMMTPKAMLVHFFEEASAGVARPIRDSSGQSVHVDDGLGPEGSLKRRVVGDAFSRVARRMRNADGARSLFRWKDLFE
ncbi:MAG: CBASS oligonucleotide cyclase [Chloroflexi bacterium]|nr:CBASS oligonucleotide cyclase [Chloroflexota bacterium]